MSHVDAVHRMALRLARNETDAADLVQETYLKALRASDRFEERAGGMRPWLFRILHNIFFSEIERAGRRPVLAEEVGAAEPTAPPVEEAPPAWDLASFSWDHVDARLRAAVDELRPEYRETLLLWAVEGLKYREIAEVTDVPIGTVMSRLHRARSLLVAAIGGPKSGPSPRSSREETEPPGRSSIRTQSPP